MNIRVKKSRIVSYVISIVSIIISFYVNKYSYNTEGYELYFLVPFFFGILVLMLPNINFTNFKDIGSFILKITMIIRYTILPLASSVGGYLSNLGIYPDSSQLKLAVIFSLYEMFIIMVLVNFFEKKKKKNKNLKINNATQFNSYIIYLVIISLGIITIILIPETIADYRFIFNQDNLTSNIRVDFPLSGIFKTVVNFSRYALVLLVINICYKRNLTNRSNFNIIISFIAILLNSLYISNLSRISALIPIVTFSILLMFIYNTDKDKRFISKIIIIIITCILFYLSFVKFFGEGRGNIDNSTSISWWGDTLNTYFMGVKEIAIGIKAIPFFDNIYGILKLDLLINDAFSQVIGLSNFTNSYLNSTYIYNIVYFGSNISISQIVPNICEGIYYFGKLFAPLWTSIFIYLTYTLENKIYSSKFIDIKFVYVYASIYSGMVLMINSSMIISNIANVSILFYIIACINKRIIISRKI